MATCSKSAETHDMPSAMVTHPCLNQLVGLKNMMNTHLPSKCSSKANVIILMVCWWSLQSMLTGVHESLKGFSTDLFLLKRNFIPMRGQGI